MHAIVAHMAAYATTEAAGIQYASSSMIAPTELCRPQRWSAGLPSADPAFNYSGIGLIGGLYNSGFSEVIDRGCVCPLRNAINRIRFVASADSQIANLCALRVRSVLRWIVCTARAFELVPTPATRQSGDLLFALRMRCTIWISDWMMSDRRLSARERPESARFSK